MSKIHKTFEILDSKDAYVIDYNNVEQSNPISVRHLSEKPEKIKFDEQAYIEEKKAEADSILQDANENAEVIIQEAQIEAESLANQIKNEAFSQGYEEGIEGSKQEYVDKIAEVQALLEELLDFKKSLFSELEPQIADLCIAITEKILYKQISEDNKEFLSVVIDAINRVSSAETIIVHLSSQQFSDIEELRQLIIPEINTMKTVNFKLEDLLKLGDCLVETECGTVDAGIETQIEKVKQVFLED